MTNGFIFNYDVTSASVPDTQVAITLIGVCPCFLF
ncbi:hypothetical protein [Ligilactobacillus pobuzihii]